MQFSAILATLALITTVHAATPVAEAARAGNLDKRVSCEIPIWGAGLCQDHCVNDHKGVKGCKGKCNSASVPVFVGSCRY
jgi:hypothetical protein